MKGVEVYDKIRITTTDCKRMFSYITRRYDIVRVCVHSLQTRTHALEAPNRDDDKFFYHEIQQRKVEFLSIRTSGDQTQS